MTKVYTTMVTKSLEKKSRFRFDEFTEKQLLNFFI